MDVCRDCCTYVWCVCRCLCVTLGIMIINLLHVSLCFFFLQLVTCMYVNRLIEQERCCDEEDDDDDDDVL